MADLSVWRQADFENQWQTKDMCDSAQVDKSQTHAISAQKL